MKIASVAEVKARFSDYLRKLDEGPVIVTRNGKSVAMLIPVADDDELERLVLAYSPTFRRIVQTARKQIHEGQGVSHEEFWQTVETDVPPRDYNE